MLLHNAEHSYMHGHKLISNADHKGILDLWITVQHKSVVTLSCTSLLKLYICMYLFLDTV